MSSGDERGVVTSMVVAYPSLGAYFHEAVDVACSRQGLEATPSSSYYVVSVLESFADAEELYPLGDDGRRREEALAQLLQAALEESSAGRVQHYRRLGDLALFVSGFFADSLRRRPVGVPYYIAMGQAAYGTLSGLFRERRREGGFDEIFEELADTFPAWVEVLHEVAERWSLMSPLEDQETVALLERLRRARGRRVSDLRLALLRRGLWSG